MRRTNIFLSIMEYAILILVSFISIAPLLSCLYISFRGDNGIDSEFVGFDNFFSAFKDGNLLLSLFISMLIVFITVIISTLLGAMIAFAISRLKFKFKKTILNLFTFAMFIPTIAVQVSVFKLMSSMNLINTLFGYILLMANTDIFAIILYLRYFDSIPKSYNESAIIDGCSPIKSFFKVHFPILKPACLTVAIIKGINVFNEFYLANLYLQDKELYPTVTTSLYNFSGPFGTQYNIICAAIIITIIPILIIFAICQKRIYNGFSGKTEIYKKRRRKHASR